MGANIPALHIVVSLVSLCVLHAYEFAYHPSAEEFDSLLRGTRSWTRNLLAEQQQQRKQFVPRYQKPWHRQRATALPFAAEKLDRPSNLLSLQRFSDEPSQAYDRPQQLVTSTNASFNSFPIFFSNPATGIVYAITQMRRADAQSLHYQHNPSDAVSSGSITGNGIPIFVSKAQYDSDLGAMRQHYKSVKSNCQADRRPNVQRKATATPPASNKLPSAKPIPIISNQLQLGSATQVPATSPTRCLNHKTKRTKKKKKHQQKRPGCNPSSTLTITQIVRGTHLTTTSPSRSSVAEKLATQLEKPHMSTAIGNTAVSGGNIVFSQQPIALSSSRGQQQPHRRQRRSLAGPTARIVSHSRQWNRSQLSKRRWYKSKLLDALAAKGTRPTVAYVSQMARSWRYNKPVQPSKSSRGSKMQQRRGGEGAFDFWSLLADTDELGEQQHKADDDDSDDNDEDNEEDDEHYAEVDSYNDEKEPPLKRSQEAANTQDNSSSAEESADFGAMEELPGLPATTVPVTFLKTKNSQGKRRIRRRPAAEDSSESAEYDDAGNDEDELSISASLSSFFTNIFYPVQLAMTRIFDGFTGQQFNENAEASSQPKYPTYTLYNNALNSQSDSNESIFSDNNVVADDDTSLSSWFSTWFGLQRRTKKIDSTTVRPATFPAPTQEPSWWESLFSLGKSEEAASSDADNDSWFFNWFSGQPKNKVRRQAGISTTTATPQVPILTIVDPLLNPQNWIGILAHQIANSTGTQNRLTHVSSSTPSPETPRRMLYDMYQIWRLKPLDESQVRTLEHLKKGEQGNKLQWFKGPTLRGLTDILVPPSKLISLQDTLNSEGIAHDVLIFDVGKAIAYETSKAGTEAPQSSKLKAGAPLSWHKYHEHDDILQYLETIRKRHSKLVELIHIGRSYEGRPLVVVKLQSKQLVASGSSSQHHQLLKQKRKDADQANAVFIEAGAHGLAWIAPAAATWMIGELLRLMRTNTSDGNLSFVHNTTWYIMPLLNPDGYVYSHAYDRFWSKSRSRHVLQTQVGLFNSAKSWLQQKRTDRHICHGVDLDRNWVYDWGKRGSSKTQPCTDFYAGPKPFSEPETKALSEFLMDYRKQLKLYVALQAYGQVLSYPRQANATYAYGGRLDDLLDVAMVGTDGLRKRGSKARYKVDATYDLIERRSGCADAFAAYEVGVPFSYTLQLADNGVHGYLLPSSAIEPTARDAFQIIGGMLDYL